MENNTLYILGLNKNERNVIDVLIKGESFSLGHLAKLAKIPRTTASYVVGKLKERGLVSSKIKDKQRIFSIESLESINNACIELKKYFVPESSNIIRSNLSDETIVTTYRGVSAINTLWQHMTTLPKESRLYGIQPDPSFRLAVQKVLTKLSYKDLLQINDNIKNNKIIIEAITHEQSIETVSNLIKKAGLDPAKFLSVFAERIADMGKISNEILNVPAEIFMFKNTFVIIHWPDEIAITIENGDIFAFFYEIFKNFKLSTERYDQNERAIKKLHSLK